MKPHLAAREASPTGRQKKLPTDESFAAPAPDAESRGAIVILGAAAIALGYALQISNGTYHPKALAWLAVACALCLSGVVTLRSVLLQIRSAPAFFLLLAGLVLQVGVLVVGAGSRLGKAAFDGDAGRRFTVRRNLVAGVVAETRGGRSVTGEPLPARRAAHRENARSAD